MAASFYTVEELAEYIKVSEQTIRLWIRKGKVKATKFGRAYRIPSEEVDRIVREGIDDDGEEVEPGQFGVTGRVVAAL